MKFYELKIGTKFSYVGTTWKKIDEKTAITEGWECSNGFNLDEEVVLLSK